MSTMPAAAEGRTPFAQFLQQQGKGSLHAELSDGLAELVEAAVATGKKGTMQLTVTVVPNKDEATVTVTPKVKLSKPEPERAASIYFHDGRGNLTRHNPRQPELPLREVRGGADDDDGARQAAGS